MKQRFIFFSSLVFMLMAGMMMTDLSAGAFTSNPAPDPEMTEQGIRYLSGGIGITERQKMEAQAEGYNLKISFARADGHYTAGSAVHITDAANDTVTYINDAGPWLYVDLPRGSYHLHVDHQGMERMKRVRLGNRMKHVVFHFKE